jgi:hypothetical protein
MSSPVRRKLLERLRELALVDANTLVAGLSDEDAAPVIMAFVSDLEDALSEARMLIRDAHRDIGAGTDPLALLDFGPERRTRAGADAIAEPLARLGQRAAARRELARLEELVQAVLPRLIEADRRYVAAGLTRG